ncbi:MAG: NAD(P)/FAD-dependent oxidoreductase [Planctomycetes bacterium]|nr:NAD(P)/FAD-dependent oxidoreductase [Planctomycetota bacterium]
MNESTNQRINAKGIAMPKKHVIIGGGPAGMHAVETIRKYETPAVSEIHLVSDEPPYSRMVIPYWMAGTIAEDHVLTSGDPYYRKDGVAAHVGRRVTKVEPAANRVMLDDGTPLAYDTLLIATGSSAARPPIPGIDLPGVHNLWTLDDARAVMRITTPQSRILFVGAGFIGFIILNALFKRGNKLAVVEMERQVLPRMLDATGGRLVESWLKRVAVAVHTGTSVRSIAKKDGSLQATLGYGQTLDADAVIIATGIRPNIGFLTGSGIKTAEGILVDQHLRTDFPNIYAAGDCAQGPDLSTGQQQIHAIQPTAIDHGRVAGANMAGKNVAYRGSLLMNVLDVCGLQCASFGRWQGVPGGDHQEVVNEGRPLYRKLLWDGDRIAGAVLLGPTGDVSNLNDLGMIKGFIQTQTPLGTWKQFLADHPLDVRRPYIACGVAEKLLTTTLLPEATADLGYRYQSAQPTGDPGPYHPIFVGTYPAASKRA